jgi:hypothetical protein
MRYFVKTIMLVVISLACLLPGAAQSTSSTAAEMDRVERKQAERNRKEQERRRREEEQAAIRQAGVRCSRLHKKN